MNKSDPINHAKVAVEKILELLQISRVIWVDDNCSDELTLEEIIVEACTLDADKLIGIFPEFRESIPDDEDVLKSQIRRLWTIIDPADRRDRSARILKEVNPKDDTDTDDDVKAAMLLSGLVPREKLQELSPSQWNERSEQLLQEDADQRTLFLFDQDLSGNGGDVDGGIKIIASLLASANSETLICGLLTHTVTPENQYEKWSELSKTYSIDKDRFLVIPKRHLSGDPALFAQTLKLIVLSPDFAKLKSKTSKIIEDAAKKAETEVEAISIYDLDHIVFQASAEEGVWEPDMLFRLHALFHRLESRRLAHDGGELERIVSKLRSVSHIPIETQFSPASSTWAIQQKELYESADYLNKNHLPLELGDIFEKIGTDSKKRYILLAQPCDIMVRKSGKRYPELPHVPMAEISPNLTPPLYSEKMAYFGDQNNVTWYVKLKIVYQIKLCLLDLCVFNDNGAATIKLNDNVSETIRPSWKARYLILSKVFAKLLKRIDLMSPAQGDLGPVKTAKASIKSQLTGDLLNEGLFKGQLVEQNGDRSIAYNCRRVGRLSRARAFGLLMAYTSCLSRPAYDGEFAMKDK